MMVTVLKSRYNRNRVGKIEPFRREEIMCNMKKSKEVAFLRAIYLILIKHFDHKKNEN